MNHCIVDFWLHLNDQENNELQAQWGTAHMPRKQNCMVLGSIQASHLSYFLSAFLKPEKFTCEKLLKYRPLHCTVTHLRLSGWQFIFIQLTTRWGENLRLQMSVPSSSYLSPKHPKKKKANISGHQSRTPHRSPPGSGLRHRSSAWLLLWASYRDAMGHGSAERHVASHWQSLSNASSCCFVAACHEATDFTRPKDAKKIQKDQKLLTWKGSISHILEGHFDCISTALDKLRKLQTLQESRWTRIGTSSKRTNLLTRFSSPAGNG